MLKHMSKIFYFTIVVVHGSLKSSGDDNLVNSVIFVIFFLFFTFTNALHLN